MRVQLPQILWHGKEERILSLDFHPFINELTTGGSDEINSQNSSQFDGYAKVWEYKTSPAFQVSFKYGLKKHLNNVSAVKYSPDARYLATGSDDHTIVVSELRENFVSVASKLKIMMWSPKYQLRGHLSQIMDIKWSNDNKYIVSGGFDKRLIIWNVAKSQYLRILEQHKKSIQGIAVDGKFKYLVSQGSDRQVKLWKNSKTKKEDTAFYRHTTIFKLDKEQLQEGEERFHLFFDQNIPTFYRRPDISPDGQLFAFPAGQWKDDKGKLRHCAFLYRKRYLQKPSFVVFTNNEAAICVRFCPKLFKKKNTDVGMLRQPYYMVFAIATLNSVIVCNTESMAPLYGCGNYHYASITELSWKDDSILGISSNDRTCSFMIFQPGELGEPYQISDPKLREMVTRVAYVPVTKEDNKTKSKEEKAATEVQQPGVGDRAPTKGKKRIVPVMIQKFDQ